MARVRSPNPQPVGHVPKHSSDGIVIMKPTRRRASRGSADVQIPQPPLVVTLDFVYLPHNSVRAPVSPILLLDRANELFRCCGVSFDVVNTIFLLRSTVEHYVANGRVNRQWDEITSLMMFSRYWHDGPRTNEGTGPRTLDDYLHRLLRRCPQRGRIPVFFVRDADGAGGFTIPNHMDREHGNLGERIFIGDLAGQDTLAHELGHALIDGRDLTVDVGDHHPDRNNLMAFGIGRTGTRLNSQQIAFIRQGATSGPQTRTASNVGRGSSKRACC